MSVDELEDLLKEYVGTLSDEKESIYASDRDLAEADIYKFLCWIKEKNT
jgi:hypothetical protein